MIAAGPSVGAELVAGLAPIVGVVVGAAAAILGSELVWRWRHRRR